MEEQEEEEEQIVPSSFLILSRKYRRLEMTDAELEFISIIELYSITIRVYSTELI